LLRLLFSTTSVYLIVIAPWFIFAALYFGSPLPNTFSAKANFFGGVKFLTDGWALFTTYYGNNPLALLALLLVPVGLKRLFSRPETRPVAIWCLAFTVAYTILNTTYFWYYVPLNLGLLICLAFGADAVARYIFQRWNTNAGFGLVAIYAVVTLIAGIVTVYPLRVLPSRMATYRLAGEWIAENTPKTATLTVADLGVTGYYARRHTVDTFGLITKNNYSIAPDYVLAKHRTDYVLLTSYYVFDRLRTRQWFQEQYAPVISFSTPGDAEFSPMTLYARRHPLETPEYVVQGTPLALTCKMALDAGVAIPRTVALVFDERGERVARAVQRFRSGDYRVALGKEMLTDQILVPTDELTPGVYRWELHCTEQHTGTFTVTHPR
jgi:hypothetical protein